MSLYLSMSLALAALQMAMLCMLKSTLRLASVFHDRVDKIRQIYGLPASVNAKIGCNVRLLEHLLL
jgi:hypothetical protein